MLINSYSAGQQLNEQEKYTALYEEAPGQIVWPLSPASWRLWAWLNSLSDSGMATGMNKSIYLIT